MLNMFIELYSKKNERLTYHIVTMVQLKFNMSKAFLFDPAKMYKAALIL